MANSEPKLKEVTHISRVGPKFPEICLELSMNGVPCCELSEDSLINEHLANMSVTCDEIRSL